MIRLWILWCGLWLASSAHAQACPTQASQAVELSVQVEPEDDVLRAAIARHLVAALAGRDLQVCEAGDRERSGLARISIHLTVAANGEAGATIAIGDAVTDKRVERTLSLTGLPRDGHALAVSVSADELLRASWAELALRDAPAPRAPVPAKVERVLAQTLRAPVPARRDELGLEALSSLGRHRMALGAGARFAHWCGEHLNLTVGAQATFGLEESAPHGQVKADALGLELDAAYAPWSSRAFAGAMLELGASIERVTFTAHARPEAEAHSFTDASLIGHARLRGWLGKGPMRGTLAVGAGYGIKPSRAYDTGRVVTSDEGLSLELRLGCGIFF